MLHISTSATLNWITVGKCKTTWQYTEYFKKMAVVGVGV